MSTADRPDRSTKAAAQLERQRRAEKRRRAINIGTLVCVLVLVAGIAFIVTRNTGPGEVTAAPAGSGKYGVTIGSKDAPHQVVVYEDFLCPFCGELEKRTESDLATAAADGKVQVEYRPFVLLSRLGDYSARATNAFAVVLDASGPETAKKMHDLLYANQPSEEGPYLSDDELVRLAVEAGATESEVRPGIEGMSQQAFVDGATKAAEDAGVQGTPTVLLDGKQVGGQTVDDVAKSLLDAVQ